MTLLVIWLGSIALGVLVAAISPRTKWWVGALSTVTLGPVGLVLIAVDAATYRERTSSPA
jgi:hypothetical protein